MHVSFPYPKEACMHVVADLYSCHVDCLGHLASNKLEHDPPRAEVI